MAMMQDMWDYTQQFHVYGNFKIEKLIKIKFSGFFFFGSVTGNIFFCYQYLWLKKHTFILY